MQFLLCVGRHRPPFVGSHSLRGVDSWRVSNNSESSHFRRVNLVSMGAIWSGLKWGSGAEAFPVKGVSCDLLTVMVCVVQEPHYAVEVDNAFRDDSSAPQWLQETYSKAYLMPDLPSVAFFAGSCGANLRGDALPRCFSVVFLRRLQYAGGECSLSLRAVCVVTT